MLKSNRFRVLYVCMGNICRSPAGEAVLRKYLDDNEATPPAWEIDSAGTHGYHVGEPADRRMIEAAGERGINVPSRARQVDPEDLQPGKFDLVLAMDRGNLTRLRQISPGKLLPDHVRLFSEFLDETWPDEVPDPYYGGDEGFRNVLDMLESGSAAVVRFVKNPNGN